MQADKSWSKYTTGTQKTHQNTEKAIKNPFFKSELHSLIALSGYFSDPKLFLGSNGWGKGARAQSPRDCLTLDALGTHPQQSISSLWRQGNIFSITWLELCASMHKPTCFRFTNDWILTSLFVEKNSCRWLCTST